jgi:hypothetical protein
MSIANEYNQMAAMTVRTWASNPGPGAPRDLPDGYYKYGISLGSHFQPTAALGSLLADIAALPGIDVDHVTIPEASYHFTFLALASHVFDNASQLPAEVSDLKSLCRAFFGAESWTLDELRLLPGDNFLLLVGTPSPDLVALRERFAATLLASPWKAFIESRHEYRGYPFPPRIWHTTLCRYKGQFLPKASRHLYEKYLNQTFGSITLAPPRLRLVNYDWSSTTVLD